MVTVHRAAIEKQLETLPADIESLFCALKIKKLENLGDRSGDDLTDDQMSAIHLFFMSVPDHIAAIAQDSYYATGKEDDLTTVRDGLSEELIKDVRDLPRLCEKIGTLYAPRLRKHIHKQIADAGVVNARALESIPKKRRSTEKLTPDEARLLLWSYAIGESCKQLDCLPREYCEGECEENKKIRAFDTVKSWMSCEEKLGLEYEFGNYLGWLWADTDQGFPVDRRNADFKAAGIIPPFRNAQTTLGMLNFEPKSGMPEAREALRLIVKEGEDLLSNDSNFPSLSQEEYKCRTEELEWAVKHANVFLSCDAMWWALEYAPLDFAAFYAGKEKIKKFAISEKILSMFDELPTLLVEIQVAYCFGRSATVAALARAVLERIMVTHNRDYKDGLGQYKEDVFKSNLPVSLVFKSDDVKELVQDAMNEIVSFGNDILHAKEMKRGKTGPRLDSDETTERMEAVCTEHLPNVINFLLPLIAQKFRS